MLEHVTEERVCKQTVRLTPREVSFGKLVEIRRVVDSFDLNRYHSGSVPEIVQNKIHYTILNCMTVYLNIEHRKK